MMMMMPMMLLLIIMINDEWWMMTVTVAMREDSKCICPINNKHMDQRLEICNRSNGYVLQKYHSNSTSLDHMLRLPQNTYPLLWASPNNAPTIYANHVATPLRSACGRRAMYAHHCRTINKSLSSWQGWQSGGNKWDQFCQIRIARNSIADSLIIVEQPS